MHTIDLVMSIRSLKTLENEHLQNIMSKKIVFEKQRRMSFLSNLIWVINTININVPFANPFKEKCLYYTFSYRN